MNSIDIIHAGSEAYYLSLGKDEYYTGHPEPEGVFLGKGARTLGIYGQEIKEDDPTLKNLFNGRTPDGHSALRQGMYVTREYYTLKNPLTHITVKNPDTKTTRYLSRDEVAQIQSKNPQNYDDRLKSLIKEHHIDDPQTWLKTKVSRSVVAYDNVFSAPKDVSILWSLAPHEKDRAKILSIHEHATRTALTYLESQASIRVGKAGKSHVEAAPVCAMFTHTTSRDLDPQLHSHVVMLNIGITNDGHTGGLDSRKILSARYASGMIYQNELRRGLEQAFRVKTYDQPFREDKGVSFGIEGISKGLINEFSRRSETIKQHIDPGMTAKQKRAEVLKTRNAKVQDLDNAKLLQEWQERGKAQGFNWDRVTEQQRVSSHSSTHDQEATLLNREVAQRLRATEQKGVITEQKLVTTVYATSRGRLNHSQAMGVVHEFKTNYLSEFPQTHGKSVYALNAKGHKVLNYRTTFERIQDTLQGLKRAQYQNRLAVLYATGKISGSDYKKYTEGKGLPKSTIGIRVHEALGLISKKQADYLVHKKQHPVIATSDYRKHTQITNISVFEPPSRTTQQER